MRGTGGEGQSGGRHACGGAIMLKVLFVGSECAPYAKCGGLADVVASLPKALRAMGVDARIAMPLYGSIDRGRYGIVPDGTCLVNAGGGEVNGCGVHCALADGGVPVWFVEHERFFARGGVYDEHGAAFGDNAFRFGLLCMAAAQICRDREWMPDVVHVHDWPTSLFPVLMESWRRQGRAFGNAGSVLTIHNQAYQGYSHPSVMGYLGLGGEFFSPDALESYGQLNLLKGGIQFADRVTTVSPTYAREVLGEPGGNGLSGYLRGRGGEFQGILNGVDYDEWNPEGDPLIPARYGADDMGGKAACKEALRGMFGLARDDAPVFGMVGRLVEQKGIGLLRDVADWVLGEMRMQLVVLGTGERWAEDWLRGLAWRHPGRVGVRIGYSNELAHRIEAGSDFFLMPSLFEPCGLSQIYALRYGTLPVVHATGGLADTIEQYDERSGAGTGFKFGAPTPQALHDAIGWAVSTWYDRREHMDRLRRQAMSVRFGWDDSARRYLEVYEAVVRRRGGGGN